MLPLAAHETGRDRVREPRVERHRRAEPDVAHVQLVNRKHERRLGPVARDERQLGVVRDEVIDDDAGGFVACRRRRAARRVSPRAGPRS